MKVGNIKKEVKILVYLIVKSCFRILYIIFDLSYIYIINSDVL